MKMPEINVTLTGSQVNQIGGYGAGINQNGELVIWAMSKNISYEHIRFSVGTLNAGTRAEGWYTTNFDTSDPMNTPYACTVTGLVDYNTIDIELNAKGINSTLDYVEIAVSITVS